MAISYLRVGNPPPEPLAHKIRRRSRVAAAVFAVFVLGVWVGYLLSQLPQDHARVFYR